MAERHSHRHSGGARSHAQPYTQHRERDRERDGGRDSRDNGRSSSNRDSSRSGGNGQPPSGASSSAPQPHSFNSHTQGQQAKAQRGAKRSTEEEEDAEAESYDPRKPHALETDPRRLEQRQKQLDLGKNTPEYKAYLAQVPVSSRSYDLKFESHPLTPTKAHACSKRSWDGQVRKWRRLLHKYDDPNAPTPEATSSKMEDDSTAAVVQPAPPALAGSDFPTLAASAAAINNAARFGSHYVSATAIVPPPAHFASFSEAPAALSIAPPAPLALTMPTQSPITSFATSVAAPIVPAPAAPAPAAVLFTSPPAAQPTAVAYDDRLASFEDDDLALLPPTTGTAATANLAAIDDEELVDYDEDDSELEMRAEMLAAARAL